MRKKMTNDKKKMAVYKLKSELLDSIASAMDGGLTTEEIIGTIETIKHQASNVMLGEKDEKRNDNGMIGYR